MFAKSEKVGEKECHICGKMCFLKGLASHIDSHIKRKCHDCGEQFTSEHLLLQHKVTHSTQNVGEEETNLVIDSAEKSKRKECHICGKMCILKGFASHVRTHSKRNCNDREESAKQFSSKCLILRHKERHNTRSVSEKETNLTINEKSENVTEKECDICGKMCLLKGFANHMRGHLRPKCHNCEVCGSQFSSKKVLEKHKVIHKTQNMCEICNKKFCNAARLKHHTCITGKLKTYVCETCGKGFAKPFNLKVHYRTHTKEKPYACDLCSNRYSQKVNLTNHYRKHLEQSLSDHKLTNKDKNVLTPFKRVRHIPKDDKSAGKNVYCDSCGKCFYDKYCLARHMRIHSNEKPYKCDICNRTFNQKSNRDSHYRNHTRKKPHEKKYACEICFQTFAFKTDLPRHHLIHTEQRPFECEFCDKAFRQSYHLKLHLRRHNGVKPYKCKKCNKSYIAFSSLVQHEKRHEEPEHICTICNKAYFYSFDLNRHMLSHTNTKPYVCDICHKGVISLTSLKQHYLKHVAQRVSYTKTLNSHDFKEDDLHQDIESSNGSYSKEGNVNTCSVCKMMFASDTDLQSHNKEFMKEGNFKCCVCLAVYVDKNQLYEHYNVHSDSLNDNFPSFESSKLEEKTYKCKICKKIFPNEITLDYHNDEFLKKDDFKCCMCHQVFITKQDLLEHYDVHSNLAEQSILLHSENTTSELQEKSAFCEICKQSFLNQAMLESHKNKYMMKRDGVFQCCMCHKMYTIKDNLFEHHKEHKTALSDTCDLYSSLEVEEKPFTCNICYGIFPNEIMLASHNAKYDLRKIFICCNCKQVYHDKERLIEHQKVHEIIVPKPYICFLNIRN